MTEFTPFSGLIGGVLIGLSAIVLMAGHGRIAGASGIFGGLLTLDFGREFQWRAVFMAGLLLGALIVWTAGGGEVAAIEFASGPVATAIAGFAVGIGVQLGNGCTSGHGICGLARLSARSLAATSTFMVSCIATVFLIRHVIGA
jgi:uncharacterized protein